MALYSIFSGRTPANPNVYVGANQTVGTAFTTTVAGNIVSLGTYRPTASGISYPMTLWSATGTSLATCTVPSGAQGWAFSNLAIPYAVAANTTYVVSTFFTTAYMPYDDPYWSAAAANPVVLTPFVCPANAGRETPANAFPNTTHTYTLYQDVQFDDGGIYVVPVKAKYMSGVRGVVGYLQGIATSRVTSLLGDSVARHMQTGVREEFADGYPTAPSLALDYPGFWRFRWQLVPGIQTISVYAKQVSNVTGKRPSMVVKADPSVGVASDVVGSAGAGAGWVKIGPLSVSASALGATWVELHNNDTDTFDSTAYFDNLGS